MRKTLVAFLLVAVAALSQPRAVAQQAPLLSELFSRYAEFNRIYAEKRRGGTAAAIEALRRRSEEAFKKGNIPDLLEVMGETQALAAGKKWDERQKFISSLTVDADRLVIEPNQILQVSLTRMFPVNIEKAFATPPTVTFQISSSETAARSGEASPPPLTQPLAIAERLTIAETSNNAARKLLLPDGAYDVVARIEAGGQMVAVIKRTIYSIGDFSSSIAQMSKTIAGIKNSTDPKVKALAPLISTIEFRHQHLAQLNRSRGEVDLDPSKEIDRLVTDLAALTKGQNPFTQERGEIERAYEAPGGKLVPYRLYVPRSYDGATSRPLVVMLPGSLGGERYYFGGLIDPAQIKAEAERRGYILAGVNRRGRPGVGDEDVFEVVAAVMRDYKIDPSRIYLSGHSIGGFDVWLVASQKPEMFAAIAAVSGGPPAQGETLTALLAKLKGIPAIIVHGAQDGLAPIQLSRTMSAEAEKAGIKVSLVEVPDADHLSVVASTFPAILDFFEKNSKAAVSK